MDLVPVTPVFREDKFQDLFVEKKNARSDSAAARGGAAGRGAPARGAVADTTKETKIVFDGIRRRLSLLPTGVNVRTVSLSPDGKTLVLGAVAEGQQNLYAFSVDPERSGPTVTRQITSTPGGKSAPQFTPRRQGGLLRRPRAHPGG